LILSSLSRLKRLAPKEKGELDDDDDRYGELQEEEDADKT
jgi:hypothetical protein